MLASERAQRRYSYTHSFLQDMSTEPAYVPATPSPWESIGSRVSNGTWSPGSSLVSRETACVVINCDKCWECN